ncbi:MAG: vanadium-dependent haloperoxidase [Nocardioides sp.]
MEPITRRTTLTSTLAALPLALTVPARGQASSPAHVIESPQVVLDWERILLRTVYTDGGTPIPNGVPLLGFTSLAMYDAATTAAHRGRSSETAAVATAAHDVLLHYFPAAGPKIGADLATSLTSVSDARARLKGARIGRAAAADLLASRVGDGYADPTIHYTRQPGVGVWQPTPPATDMLGAWIGSLRPLVVDQPTEVAGPDPLTSAAYAMDDDEVRRLGGTGSVDRTPAETATALFYTANAATMVGDAVVRRLESRPIGLVDTARIFAGMHAAMTDAVITCWRLKRDVGFWRPSQAISGAAADGNPATAPEPGWTPLVPNPPYSEYVSGHACLTAPAVEVIRRTLGEDTTLELRSVTAPTRVYTQLSHLEYDAFRARIWSGLHFRTAMRDGYAIGHDTAARVLRELDRR